MPACDTDGQTEGEMDRHMTTAYTEYHAGIALHGKNCNKIQ